jgi:hypothetical protein
MGRNICFSKQVLLDFGFPCRKARPPNAKTTPMQNRDAIKAVKFALDADPKNRAGRRREFHPSFVSVFNRAGSAKSSGGGVGAPKLNHGPPNLGGQYQSMRKTCQEEIAKKSQNVRCKSQRMSICSGCVAKRPQNIFSLHKSQ